MKKFSIEYHETYSKTYEIEANSPEEAEEILRDMICNGEENAPEECRIAGVITYRKLTNR